MAKFPVSPIWLGSQGAWAASLHLVSPAKKSGDIPSGLVEAIVISHESKDGVSLKGVRFQSPSTKALAAAKDKGPIKTAPAGWLEPIISTYSNSPSLSTADLAPHMDSRTFRNIFTGHLLAYRFMDLLIAKHSLQENPISGKGLTLRYALPAQGKETITETTSRIYKELQAWGESTPAWLIAQIEGVAVNTIYGRLNEGRKKELLTKPGKGARKSRS